MKLLPIKWEEGLAQFVAAAGSSGASGLQQLLLL